MSIADVAGAIGEATGRPDLLRLGALPAAEGDPPALVGDASRLRDEVGWRPSHDLAEGLRLTVERLGAAVAT